MFSVEYKRDEKGVYGFECSCGFRYFVPPGLNSNEFKAKLVDGAISNHELKHTIGAANE